MTKHRKTKVVFTIILFFTLIMFQTVTFAWGLHGHINSDNVNLQVGPSVNSDVVVVLNTGEEVQYKVDIKDENGTWWATTYVVKTQQHGYVKAGFITYGQ